jgi:hypothetical protein
MTAPIRPNRLGCASEIAMSPALRHDLISEATLVFASAMVCYTANGETITTGDALPARHLPFAILRHGTFYLDDFPFLYEGKDAYWARKVGEHYVSFYPVGAAVLALPFYVPAVFSAGTTHAEARSAELEKLAASGTVALSVAFLYAALTRLASRRWAFTLAVAYGLGTSSLSVSSQALWQHGPAQLCLALGIFFFVLGRERPLFTMLAGLPLAFAIVSAAPARRCHAGARVPPRSVRAPALALRHRAHSLRHHARMVGRGSCGRCLLGRRKLEQAARRHRQASRNPLVVERQSAHQRVSRGVARADPARRAFADRSRSASRSAARETGRGRSPP